MLATWIKFYLKSQRRYKSNSGFTLIELLVVVLIMGILASVGIPSYLSQIIKARQAEAKSTISSVIRAQLAYYTENGQYTDKWNRLALGIRQDTDNYRYDIYLLKDTLVGVFATPKYSEAKSYVGGVGRTTEGGEPVQVSGMCESNKPGASTTNKNAVDIDEIEVGQRRIKCNGDFKPL